MGNVVAVAVPVVIGSMTALGHEHRPTSLGQKQQREAGGHGRILDPTAAEGPRQAVLGGDEHASALQVPVRITDEPSRREPPHPFETVEIVVEPRLATGARIFHDGEPATEPLQAAFEHLWRRPAAAARDGLGRGPRVGRADMLRGDPDAGDSRAGHAARAGRVADGVAPRAVGIGARRPVLLGPGPDLAANTDAGLVGLVQREQCELGVGIVAGSLVGAIRPGACRRSLRHLRPLQPVDIAFEDGAVGVGREHRQYERLQGDGVGLVGLLPPQPVEAALHGEMAAVDARIGQRQHDQRRGAHPRLLRAHRALPGAIRLLLTDQPVAGLLDSPLDLLG